MIGDVLKNNLYLLKNTSINKNDENAFWRVLQNIAYKEIMEFGGKIDSDFIIPLYYEILSRNLEYIPEYFKEKLPSNKQERYRVIIRNLFSSNAFHVDGLANKKGIIAKKTINEYKKGERIVFQKEVNYVN